MTVPLKVNRSGGDTNELAEFQASDVIDTQNLGTGTADNTKFLRGDQIWAVPTAGEANTASNVGAGGVGVFKQKTGVNLEFRNINALNGKITVALDGANNEIDIGIGALDAGDVTSGTFADARISQSSVTQHQAALSIAASQLTGNLAYARLPTGSGTWDVGAGNAITITRDLEVSGALTKGGTAVALAGHTHDAADIASGTIATARLGSGTANNTTFLRGDQTWAAPPGGGGGEANTASNVNAGGVGVFKQKAGVDLEFRGINAASTKITVALDSTNNEVDINVGVLDAGDVTTGTFADARISQSSVTQHQAALSIAGSQLTGNIAYARLPTGTGSWDTGVGTTITITRDFEVSGALTKSGTAVSLAGHTHATGDITSGTFADARISQSSVTQHQAALSIAASQLTGTIATARLGSGTADSTTVLHGDQTYKTVVTSKGISILNPVDEDKVTLFYTDRAIDISRLAAVLVGSASPSVTYTIKFDADRNATGTEVVTGGSTVTSTTTGGIVTTFDDDTIPADNWVWLHITALSGTVTEFHLTIRY